MIMPFIIFFLSSTQALPEGAPSSACQTLMPFHGGGLPAQTEISPYSIEARRQGRGVFVSVGSSLGIRFQGFMLQARTPEREVLGEFDVSSTVDKHSIDCANKGDTITHNSPQERDSLDVLWKPPQGYEGPVIFNATIAQRYDSFWVGIESPTVQITRRSVDDSISENTLYPNRLSTTTPPNFNPQKETESYTDFDPFYEGCMVSKLCFGAPENCVNSRSCKAIVAVTVTGDKYDFELKADSNAAWVGVGLSDDDKMGEDSVIECVKNGNDVAAYMSWTTIKPYTAVRLSNPQLGIQLLNSSVINDVIYCKVRRDSSTNVNGKMFDLVNNKYNLLIASGSSVSASTVTFHGLSFLASGQSQALADVSALAAASKLLIRLHGSFMLAAWIGTASIGILLARYYRQTWIGTTLMGKDLWFAWHRVFMVLTWTLTLAAVVLIFVELKEWSGENNPHAILGIITTILCFFQPIGAYFRPHPGTSKRTYFNWAHWFIGNVAHIIAIVAIFFAVKLTKAELPDFVDWILVAYVVVHFLSHLLLSVMGCLSEKSSESRVTSFPMKDLGGSGRSSTYADRSPDAPFSTCRKFILAIFILIILAIVIALIIITALAPIEETWKNLKASVKSN